VTVLEPDLLDMTEAEHEARSKAAKRTGLLTHEEDSELRRLHYLANLGTMSLQARERFVELRARDRRAKVREPREFEIPIVSANRRRWIERVLRNGR
jgi:hypothetical protein